MGYAERIYEQLKHLPEPVAKEVLDFAEFMAARQSDGVCAVSQADRQHRRSEIERTFAKYQVDLSHFRFDREEANARC
ncbi:MAG: DUF2281 domain-containing protein [Burkholderiaceae bacterium]|jgi:hypothetical protein|nr:DUF2281 domain-containing protein [Burkholderiaceae bacterium]